MTLCGHLYCWPCLYRWLQVQSHCRTCPVCKAGVEKDKVREAGRKLAGSEKLVGSDPSGGALRTRNCCHRPALVLFTHSSCLSSAHRPFQVIPIYGRGGNEDPRSKVKGEVEAVPQRPAGQRPVPVVRNPLLQPNVNVNAQQGGLGIIPTLFGLQNGNGAWVLRC